MSYTFVLNGRLILCGRGRQALLKSSCAKIGVKSPPVGLKLHPMMSRVCQRCDSREAAFLFRAHYSMEEKSCTQRVCFFTFTCQLAGECPDSEFALFNHQIISKVPENAMRLR